MTRVMKIVLVMACLSMAACAHRSTSPDGEQVAAPGKNPDIKDIGSFRLSDSDGPKVVAEELETIPTEMNPLVEKWISYFQGRGRGHMERYLARSTRYEKLMKKVLRDNGLPEDIFYIALIESGFTSNARSHASAVGYWQFIRGTGTRYGLEINAFVDERRDPVLATQAAAEYFKGLYSVFGSWYLAMASYNVGENRVKREVMNHYTRDFWELARKKRFPKETINYIPKYIAAKLIGKDPAKYGFEGIDYMPPIEFDHIEVKNPTNLRLMADKMGINYEDFKALNPKFKGEVAPLRGSALSLRIPPGMNEAAMIAANESVVDRVQFVADSGDTQVYRIRSGDSLFTVARKYRTTVAYLRDLNDLPRGKKMRVGMKLYVPDRTPAQARSTTVASVRKGPVKKNPAASPELTPAQAPVSNDSGRFYIVQTGDSLYTIAQRYSTSVSELQKINNLRRGRMLKVGIKLRLPSQEADGNMKESKTKSSLESGMRKVASANKRIATVLPAKASAKKRVHVVRRGENLSDIAQKYRVSMNDLTSKNRIKNPSKLFVGSRLLIPQAIAAE